jgi:NhaP-type Na+/H+ or K+/H+ antiporter
MPLTMLAIFAVAHWLIGLDIAAALLLAAALAPTDPVLAADVQSGPPNSGDGGETRFGLTSEAGLNDGLAFPFILLAIAMQMDGPGFTHWFIIQFLGELLLGILVGWGFGRVSGYLIFRLPRGRLSDSGDGLVAIGVTLLTYAVTMALHGNGFVAVFIAALTIRSVCPDDEFHIAMAAFSSQVERVLLMLVLLVFGWAVGRGLLNSLSWRDVGVVFAILFVFRPIAAWIGFWGAPLSIVSKRLIGFFGIRGIGTIFYLQYAFNRALFPARKEVWAGAGLAILSSILLHGVTSTPLMAWADRRRARRQASDGGEAVVDAG